MKKKIFKLTIFISLIILLQNCGGVKDALTGQKRSEQSDEFLVKKKNPLQMPPDMNKLPEPGDSFEISEEEYKDDVKDLLKIKDNNPENSSNESDLLNNMKKKIQ
tara:strand:+ start:339 stop:653 length:315 start_codon:yes stop_codon:yes gene_type:complete